MKGTEMKESFSNVTVAKKKIHVSDCFNDSYMNLSVPRAGLSPFLLVYITINFYTLINKGVSITSKKLDNSILLKNI